MEFLFMSWAGGVTLGAVVGVMSMIGILWHLELDVAKNRKEVTRTNAAIAELRKDGWTTLAEDEAKRLRAARPRAKNGRFLSRDDAARAQGVPVDFARAVARIEAGALAGCRIPAGEMDDA